MPAFGWLLGEDAPLSASTIDRLKANWEKEYQSRKNRPLEEEYLYVWADGVYRKGGPIDETLSILVVLGVNRDGKKEILALEEGYRESEESWTDLLRELKKHGVKWIGLAISDGNSAFQNVLKKVFSSARFQRCWVHKMRNVMDKVPKKAHDEVLGALREMYNAQSCKQARKLKQQFITRYRTLYPKAVKSLEEAGDALLPISIFLSLTGKV